MQPEVSELGRIVSVNGSGATARLTEREHTGQASDTSLTVGHLVGVLSNGSLIVGTVVHMSRASPEASDSAVQKFLQADIDFMGEIRQYGSAEAYFQRGISNYPLIGSCVTRLRGEDVSVVHRIAGAETIDIGRLRLDGSIHALVNFEELLRKHFAVLGTTGVGKSTVVALLMQEILRKKADLRIFLIDPHNEYGECFGEMAHVISPKNLTLPFWLFNFEETVDVIFRGRPGVEEETELLQELIPIAKARFAGEAAGKKGSLRRLGTGFTADTPVPYRISDLVGLINDEIGKLENRSVRIKYFRLIGRIETLGNDSRYRFMFDNLYVQDIMAAVLADLFRLPAGGKPITVMHLAGFPGEVLDAVVSVLCRMAFEFGVWSDGAAPILVACEEAHRYATADASIGFGPTRKALARIAKEGRKYSVYLGAITQRPADLDPTILSQCSTVFAMRLANERDKTIIKAAVPDAGASMVDFLSSLGNREAIAFGEGVPLPTRIRFMDLPADRIPRSQTGALVLPGAAAIDADFLGAVVERWRDATISSTKRSGLSDLDKVAELGPVDDGLGASLLPRKTG